MKKFLVALLALVFVVTPFVTQAGDSTSIAEKVKGRILLQVQSNGEAWYVNPANLNRYYLGRPTDAFDIMRFLSLGVTDADLAKVPEYNSNSSGDQSMVNRVKGRILLQVEQNGEAWYVSPVNGKRYFMGRPADAFQLMRNLGLGVTNDDLGTITTDTTDDNTETVRSGDANVILSADPQSDGVNLSWTKSNRGSNFKYYKVVRSETNDDPTYSKDGYIKAVSNIDTLTYTDSSAVNGKSYYYRTCILYSSTAGAQSESTSSSTQEECSNVVKVTAENTSSETALTAPTLSATADQNGVDLSWTKNTESNFKYYKVVRSQTDSSPTYPEDGYIAVKTKDQITYTDEDVTTSSSGTYYYRICSVNTAGSVYCGNTVPVQDGSVN
ncbi:hypothetical protein KKC60_04455 [Patescibacteria group bacterium]|nr:hypothetical protein [Patescibacteria group bacterium]